MVLICLDSMAVLNTGIAHFLKPQAPLFAYLQMRLAHYLLRIMRMLAQVTRTAAQSEQGWGKSLWCYISPHHPLLQP